MIVAGFLYSVLNSLLKKMDLGLGLFVNYLFKVSAVCHLFYWKALFMSMPLSISKCVLLLAEICILMFFKQGMFAVGLHVTGTYYLVALPTYPYF